jgi:hypothetical protein
MQVAVALHVLQQDFLMLYRRYDSYLLWLLWLLSPMTPMTHASYDSYDSCILWLLWLMSPRVAHVAARLLHWGSTLIHYHHTCSQRSQRTASKNHATSAAFTGRFGFTHWLLSYICSPYLSSQHRKRAASKTEYTQPLLLLLLLLLCWEEQDSLYWLLFCVNLCSHIRVHSQRTASKRCARGTAFPRRFGCAAWETLCSTFCSAISYRFLFV